MPTYSRSEFLARWRVLRGYAPVRYDADVEVADLPDADLQLLAEMDEWYTRLLREGDPSLLEPEDIAIQLPVPPPEDGCIALSLPPGVMRVLCVRLSGWTGPATVVTDPGCALARRQRHPFTRATSDAPMAVLTSDYVLRLYPATDGDILESLVCAIRRDGEYSMHSSALGSILKI